MSEIRVIGTPRSGTNLIKYLVETSTDCVCRFNAGWWKHSIVPPLMIQGGIAVPDDLPTVIMFREPSRQVVSFYNFAAKGRTAISGASSFETFVTSPIVMTTPGEANRYTFRTPIDYWSQFYYAVLEWRHPNKVFIELSDLQAEPGLTLAAMRRVFPDRSFASMPSLPEQYLGRNGDAPISEVWGYETDTTLRREAEAAEALLASAAHGSHLATPFALELYDRLQAQKLRG